MHKQAALSSSCSSINIPDIPHNMALIQAHDLTLLKSKRPKVYFSLKKKQKKKQELVC